MENILAQRIIPILHLFPKNMALLLQAFNEFDVDGGGNISTKELGWAMRAMGMNPTENDLLELINEVNIFH